MARMKNITTIDTKIEKIKQQIVKTEKRYNKLSESLQQLQKEKDRYQAGQILLAFKNSRKSYRELMTFLGA